MAGAEPEEVVRLPIAHQDWRDVTFLHWAVAPEAIARLLPEGVEPDLFDGQAWVSLTPFSVRGFRLPLTPTVPRLSDFPETNVRTYVRGPGGVDGLWFLTAEVDSLANLGVRPLLGVPYRWAAMEVSGGTTCTYLSSRRGAPEIGHDIEVTAGAPLATQDARTAFLTGRWRGISAVARRLVAVPVQHEPWPLWSATVSRLDETLVESCGLPAPATEPIVQWSPGVDVRFGPPRLL
ncbi:MAG TPA: DUF2071 domain-containing protein [Acidimicrobiales bacterium]|nr:DUF2071 domain-containing protein [Acidimicrobiales bacterium]